jgi:hypothetical protein
LRPKLAASATDERLQLRLDPAGHVDDRPHLPLQVFDRLLRRGGGCCGNRSRLVEIVVVFRVFPIQLLERRRPAARFQHHLAGFLARLGAGVDGEESELEAGIFFAQRGTSPKIR